MKHPFKNYSFLTVSVLLCVFLVVEVNYPRLAPQSELALFAMLGLIVVFLRYPLHRRFANHRLFQMGDVLLIAGVLLCFGYVVCQTEPIFSGFWLDGKSLGDRAGAERSLDYLVGGFGLLLILEATRRSIGVTLPLLALLFLLYAAFGQLMPSGLFPHRGYSVQRIVSQTFLHSQGAFGIALRVMFTYVFLFVLFGTLLERTGATRYVLNLAERVFGKSVGAPAKVAVLSSGMMGSLSGSAVANTATTGTFTIPLMRRAGFRPELAGGIEAAASSGGALVPPIMGAAAYMMLEIVEPAVTYLEIIRAALLPAILYYTGMLFMVHFSARLASRERATATETADSVNDSDRSESTTSEGAAETAKKLLTVEGGIFLAAFVTLIGALLMGATAFRAVSWSLLTIVVISAVDAAVQRFRGERSQTEGSALRESLNFFVGPCERAAQSGVSLIAASACVGIILGVVTLTGIGGKLPSALLPVASTNLMLALFFLMISTIILGMGLPSSVCYLLMAILVGPVLLDLGVVPLAAHFFIFYFGMMSMVTPPVALAAYAAAAIAGSGIMATGFAAFRFALVGFALPYAFVLRPALLWLGGEEGGSPALWSVSLNFSLTLAGTVILAAAIAGYIFNRLAFALRCVLFIGAFGLFFVPTDAATLWVHAVLLLSSGVIFFFNWRKRGDVGYETSD